MNLQKTECNKSIEIPVMAREILLGVFNPSQKNMNLNWDAFSKSYGQIKVMLQATNIHQAADL